MRNIRVRGLFTIAAASVLFILPAVASVAQLIDITVMTQNLYLGADASPILKATNLDDLQAAIVGARDSVVANDFPLRAEAIASEVATRAPLLIGLQESEIVSESDAPQPLNYADTLIAALRALGLNYAYKIVGLEDAVHTGFTLDSAVAGIFNPRFTLTDQEVVLVRTDVPNFTIKSISARTFANDEIVVNPLFGQFALKRGYVLVDASLDGVPFQFVSTHLAGTHDSLEPAEVDEILTALGTTDERQLVVGDFNARPDEVCGGSPCGPKQMLAAGFTDTGPGLGSTCCQSPTLDNPSSLNNRYDYIFERGFRAISSAALVGDQPFEAERPLWPSDHAGVTATIAEVAGTPGFSNCLGVSISTLSQQFGNSLDAAAKVLGFSDVRALRNAVRAFCRL